MKEQDPLNSLLREWKAPEPSPELDARVRASYRAAHQPSLWRRIWSVRVTIPVPVLAALLVVVALAWFQFRASLPAAKPVMMAPWPDDGYLTRIETAGFQALPDGAIRIIRSGEVK